MGTRGGRDPIIYSYLQKFQEDPTSRVFAPLAEAYRKTGMIDEAISIAREGLKVHPDFVSGKVALARALFDKKSYADVVEVLKSVVLDVPDNLIAQRLFADSQLQLGNLADALGAFKMLLYFNPMDEEIAQAVRELETRAYDEGVLLLRTDPKPEEVTGFRVVTTQEAVDNDPVLRRESREKRLQFLLDTLRRTERYRLRARAT